MKDNKDITSALTRMTELLLLCENQKWAIVFKNLNEEFAFNPQTGKRKILSIYGGMGSPNDIVLYRNGTPLLDENNEFDSLRSHLHTLCMTK